MAKVVDSSETSQRSQMLALVALVYLVITAVIVYFNAWAAEITGDPSPLFAWMSQLPVSQALSMSVWMFPIIQAFHLVVLTVLLGSLLMVDLRLLGLGFSGQPLARVARSAQPWVIAGLIGMVLTGLPQLMQNAIKEYYSPYFWVKMEFLLAAVIFTFTVRRLMTLHATRVGFGTRTVALVSLTLWLMVAINGRLIGLLS